MEEENVLLKKKIEELEELVITDPLTKVYNLRYFRERLAQELARAVRHKNDLSLIMVDVDDFKKCNDSYGHLEGDCLLQEVAKVLLSCSRRTDIVCRYGGDEFTIILPQTPLKDAHTLGEKIRKDVGNLHLKCTPTLSIGIADLHNNRNLFDLINNADHAMYQSKKGGKNRISDLIV